LTLPELDEGVALVLQVGGRAAKVVVAVASYLNKQNRIIKTNCKCWGLSYKAWLFLYYSPTFRQNVPKRYLLLNPVRSPGWEPPDPITQRVFELIVQFL
jgi:hypothetical protein